MIEFVSNMRPEILFVRNEEKEKKNIRSFGILAEVLILIIAHMKGNGW